MEITPPLTFQAGDIVCLKSNTDVAMTVAYINELGDVICVWLSEKGEKRQGSFNHQVLETFKKKDN